jgi:hypothetical protein
VENLDDDDSDSDDVDISRTWESIRENKKALATENLKLLWVKEA